MKSIFRKVLTTTMASSSSLKPTNLQTLTSHLRLYKPPPSFLTTTTSDVDDRGKVFSQMGLTESSIQKAETFRPNRAAVLVCLFEGDAGDLRAILTKRSSSLSSHAGEVSLPGGKAEEGDADDRETALREAKEEIGLDPGSVNVVTVLEPFLSKHLLRVVPVIGILPNKQAFKPALNPSEVDAVFDVPLEMFLKDENRRSKEIEWLGNQLLIHYFDYESGGNKFVIWGLTAIILIRAASVVYQRPPSFVVQDRSKFRIPNNANRVRSRQ